MIVNVATLSATIPLEISPSTTIGEIKQLICDSQRMSADQFDIAFQGTPCLDVAKTADACGLSRDCFLSVLEKPSNPVSFTFSHFFGKNLLGPSVSPEFAQSGPLTGVFQACPLAYSIFQT